MGYETTVYIVTSHEPPRFDVKYDSLGKRACWMGMLIAKIELCKMSGDHALEKLFEAGRKRNKEEQNFPYVNYLPPNEKEEGHPILEDCYGDPLGHHRGADVLQALEGTMAKNLLDGEKPYRRFSVLLATLQTILRAFPPDNIWVLTYGH